MSLLLLDRALQVLLGGEGQSSTCLASFSW